MSIERICYITKWYADVSLNEYSNRRGSDRTMLMIGSTCCQFKACCEARDVSCGGPAKNICHTRGQLSEAMQSKVREDVCLLK